MSNPVAQIDALTIHPLPNAVDGRYDWHVKSKTEIDRLEDETYSFLNKAVHCVEGAVKSTKAFNPSLIPAFAQVLQSPDAIDDRTGIFVNIIAFLSSLPQGSRPEKWLNDLTITILYGTLPHPPATYLGTPAPLAPTPVPSKSVETLGNGTTQTGVPAANTEGNGLAPAPSALALRSVSVSPQLPYAFRSADGSGNNALMPNLGKAGMPYARSVQNQHPLPPNTLPDSGLVFDVLLKADDWRPHPGGTSSLTFAFASLVTHMLFRTDRYDLTINNTSSYLDLSVLYGNNQAQQDSVRDKAQGRGYLYPDCFAEDRLVLVPPAASALLVIFSRNHNYICEMLLKINERKRWVDPSLLKGNPTQLSLQDEEIFQTARLVNCGHFMSMILGDYVAGFLGLGRDGSTWSMKPFDPIKTPLGGPVGRGEGNHCSVEFNLLYRWHTTISQNDISWTDKLFRKFIDDPSTAKLEEFGPAVAKAWTGLVDHNPKTRTFSDLKRDPNTMKFDDDDLARVLQDATEHMAGAYRAQGTPEILRLIEMMGIEQGRQWGVCTMNEFRNFLGLKPFKYFEDWCSNKAISEAARQMYGHIDNLELYPGLQAEDCMPIGPGSGICCGYTMIRAILGDAIALVRGDRFYTTDYTPHNLTAWGFQDCARDPNNGAFGAALPKLLLRHLPRHYPPNSVYALFPFSTPITTKNNLTKLGIVDKYDLERPKPQPIPKVVDTISGIRYVFAEFTNFKVPYGQDIRMPDNGFSDEEKYDADTAWCMRALFPSEDSMVKYAEEFKNFTRKMLHDHSYKMKNALGTRVDVIHDVVNLVAVHWVTDYLIGVGLKTHNNPKGMFTGQEFYDMLSLLFDCIFLNNAPENGWTIRQGGRQVHEIFNKLIEKSLDEVTASTSGILSGLLNTISNLTRAVDKPYHAFLAELANSGRPKREIVAGVISIAIGSSVNYAQATSQVIDFYLDKARAKDLAEIQELVHKTDSASTELLRGYVREAMRLNPPFPGLFRVAKQADSIVVGQNKEDVDVQPRDVIFSSVKNAHLNPNDFPSPYKVDPTRPQNKYQPVGAGSHYCLTDFVEQMLAETIKVVFSLKNVRRAEGAAGNMAKFVVNTFGTDSSMYLDSTGNVSPFPGSLTIVYDE